MWEGRRIQARYLKRFVITENVKAWHDIGRLEGGGTDWLLAAKQQRKKRGLGVSPSQRAVGEPVRAPKGEPGGEGDTKAATGRGTEARGASGESGLRRSLAAATEILDRTMGGW